nr:MAG TPA: hypothetical protein [Caudoviricetes sp.]
MVKNQKCKPFFINILLMAIFSNLCYMHMDCLLNR